MQHFWLTDGDGDVSVPDIAEDRLMALLGLLRPLYRDDDGVIREIAVDDIHPRNTAFTWDPKVKGEVEFSPVREIKTDHTCGYHMFFKPSLAEILSQLPDDLDPIKHPGVVNAFFIDTRQPLGIYRSGSGHRAVTVFGRIGE